LLHLPTVTVYFDSHFMILIIEKLVLYHFRSKKNIRMLNQVLHQEETFY
jgi:hypothetical protein